MPENVQKYVRKPFYVDAMQVTEDNIAEVAKWCGGEIRTEHKTEEELGEKYIKVYVFRPMSERQSRAYVDDWILYAGTGFKVYTPRAFEKGFERVTELAQAVEDYGKATDKAYTDTLDDQYGVNVGSSQPELFEEEVPDAVFRS